MNWFCILLASFRNLLTHLQKATMWCRRVASRDVTFIDSCTFSYLPFAGGIRPSNSSAAPRAAAVSAMAGMGSDWARGRQRRMTGMLQGWTKGLIVIHEVVSAAAPGLGGAAGWDGQGETEWVQNEQDGPLSVMKQLVWHGSRNSANSEEIHY